MDKRQQKTRKIIMDSFIELMESKNYSKIRVSDILQEANIARSTFYAHFETKDMLLQEICTNIFSHAFQNEMTHPKESTTLKQSLEEMITHFLIHLRDDETYLVRLMKAQNNEIFFRYFKESLDDYLVKKILPEGYSSNSILPNDFLIDHISSSFITTINWWIQKGLKTPANEVANYYLAAVLPLL